MQLSTLLQDYLFIPTDLDFLIHALTLDSRSVKPQDVFIAIQGTTLNGRQYIDDAIARGAKAVLVDAENKQPTIEFHHQTPIILIQQLNKKVGELAARFYDYPAKKLRMIGVTGTNGKTSCAHFIAQMLESLNVRCGILGTLGNGFYGELIETGLTTPDAITLQKTLHDFVTQGAKAVVMEVSSHSIAQGRIHGIEFEMGIFTNLTQDHLDYHGDMETYAEVKHRFIKDSMTQHVIINADDPYGRRWIDELAQRKPVYAYSLHEDASSPHVPTTYADKVKLTLQGMSASLHTPWGEGELQVPVIGQFNLSNVLAVVTALCAYGIPFQDVLQKLRQLKSVPGRMQIVAGEGKPLCVVDYAHTPDALEKALRALRLHTKEQLICVFGCGGDRDTAKRPLMAKVVEQCADRVIVTSDNPRHEKPEAIAEQIMQGFSHPENIHIELDRAKAIEKSIQWAKQNDGVLIAGKGAEHYQQIGDEKIPFDDVKKVTEIFHAILVK